MAHDILSILIANIAYESAFGVHGRMLNYYKSFYLSLVCAANWIKSSQRNAKTHLGSVSHYYAI